MHGPAVSALRASAVEISVVPARSKPVIGVSVGYHDFGDYQGVGFQRPLVRAGAIPTPKNGIPAS